MWGSGTRPAPTSITSPERRDCTKDSSIQGLKQPARRRKAVAFTKPTTYTKQEESTMTTAIIFHEVQDGAVWAKAWKKGPGSRHEMFGKLGVQCRNFRDPNNLNATGVMAEIPDMAKFQQFLQSDEGQRAMREDGLKVETMRMLVEFTP
jgi:hypothetical protein